jgi:hypothetical protein
VKPSFSRVLALYSTGKSSILETIRCLPFFVPKALATPFNAKLLDSALPEVKMNSWLLAPRV